MNIKKILLIVAEVFSSAILIVGLLVIVAVAFYLGYSRGVNTTISDIQNQLDKLMTSQVSPTVETTNQEGQAPVATTNQPTWTGPELWEAVNKRRKELGVNPLDQRDELCTIAAIRLNNLLELGKLDGHEGFGTMPDDRPDLRWIFEKYNLSEFLVSGAQSAQEAVSLWENTLAHKKLLSGGEYVWGCIYAQAGTAVAIAAY